MIQNARKNLFITMKMTQRKDRKCKKCGKLCFGRLCDKCYRIKRGAPLSRRTVNNRNARIKKNGINQN